MNFLGRLSHPNLVKLMGYCYEGKELLLVYEFMQRGSLENHLFGSKNSCLYGFNIRDLWVPFLRSLNFAGGASVQPLPWDIRIKISIGAARGLSFLHTSDKKVIYRDFKASNILLDGVSSALSIVSHSCIIRLRVLSLCTEY